MKYLKRFNESQESVNLFEKGKFWTINGKKCKVVGSIPQNQKVLKFQEVDKTGNPLGKVFVGNKSDVKAWKETAPADPTESKNKFKKGDLAAYRIGEDTFSVKIEKVVGSLIFLNYEGNRENIPVSVKIGDPNLMTEKEMQEFQLSPLRKKNKK